MSDPAEPALSADVTAEPALDPAATPAGAAADGVAVEEPAGDINPSGTLAVIVLVTAVLAGTARSGAVPLLVGTAVLQALLAFSWIFGTSLPGRRGSLVLATLAAAGSDVAVSVRPHDGLGALLVVVGLLVPAMFVHQLLRGAARVRLLESLGLISVLLVCVVGIAAWLQLWHEFGSSDGGRVVSGLALATGLALVGGLFVDLIIPVPRFDPAVDRGLLGVVAAAVLGGLAGYLMLHTTTQFAGGRGLFVGAALGALVTLLAVAAAFVERSTPTLERSAARRMRVLLPAVVPLALIAPVAFLIALAIRA